MGFLDSFTSMLSIGLVIAVIMLVVTTILIITRYKTCSSNQILVKYGQVGGGESSKQIHGGGTFVWPVIQSYAYLSLDPMNVDVPLRGALSKQNIRVNVPSSFTFAISTMPEVMKNAAERLLHKTPEEIKSIAQDIIFGELRATIGSMNIEDINGDREAFGMLVLENIDTELRKIGLYLVNTNIQDITDESGYLEALGKRAAAEAVNKAKVEVAGSNREGAEGEAAAKALERRAIAEANASAVSGENAAAIVEAESKAAREVAEAAAKRTSDAAKAVKAAEAEAEGYAAQQAAETARAERDRATMFADLIVPAQIAAEKLVVDATAGKDAASLEAEAIRLREAAPLIAQAEGFKAIVEAAGGNAQAAALMMIIDQMPRIVEAQAQAISNIKFGEITVIGGGQNGAGGAADFLQSTITMLPTLHGIASAAGITLPEMLGKSLDRTSLPTPASDAKTEQGTSDVKSTKL